MSNDEKPLPSPPCPDYKTMRDMRYYLNAGRFVIFFDPVHKVGASIDTTSQFPIWTALAPVLFSWYVGSLKAIGRLPPDNDKFRTWCELCDPTFDPSAPVVH